MFLNLHIFKVRCAFNGERKDFLVVAHDLTSAEREVFEFWDAREFQKTHKLTRIKSFRVESISRLGAVIECTGQAIAPQS